MCVVAYRRNRNETMSLYQAMSKDLTFIEEGHEYYYGTIKLPSVSQIIAPLYDFSGINANVLQYAADRGTDVHYAAEKYIKYGWTSKLDTDAQPYFDQFLKFMEDKDRRQFECEVIGHNKVYNYAGCLDLLYTDDCNDIHLIDIKTSAIVDLKTAIAQLSGYSMIAESHGIKLKSMSVLHLTPTAYKPYDIKLNKGIFLACLAIYNYKQKGK